MSLADLIKKRKPKKTARANPANFANDKQQRKSSLAKLATLALATTADGGALLPVEKADAAETLPISQWWRFYYVDREPKIASFSPEVNYTEALAGEPDAVSAEPFAPVPQQPKEPLGEEQEAEILAWLTSIDETDEQIIAAVLDQCRTDREARDYYLAQASQMRGSTSPYYENYQGQERWPL